MKHKSGESSITLRHGGLKQPNVQDNQALNIFLGLMNREHTYKDITTQLQIKISNRTSKMLDCDRQTSALTDAPVCTSCLWSLKKHYNEE